MELCRNFAKISQVCGETALDIVVCSAENEIKFHQSQQQQCLNGDEGNQLNT
jgi:hypothetical protein